MLLSKELYIFAIFSLECVTLPEIDLLVVEHRRSLTSLVVD